jgi:16S rRNA (cytidine1402-2'-O)-methyltransferase
MVENVAGSLFVVSTPIGNLGDITYRAIQTLKDVKRIAAEDTRRTRVLLKHYDIATPLSSFNSYNQERKAGELVRLMVEGDDVALVSDAGTPGISDPLFHLVGLALEHGIKVCPLPGASALLAALTVSGLPVNRFWFEGFLPRKKRRRKTLESLATQPGTVVLFESPQRIEKTLGDLLEVFGNRQAALARELTKMHEEVLRGTLEELVAAIRGRKIRGECTLVISGEGYSGREGLN